jgi:hypothetical protein
MMKKQVSVSTRTKLAPQSSDKEEREVDSKKNEKLIETELASLASEIWKKYDLDGNGVLDREEIKSFVADILNDVKLD